MRHLLGETLERSLRLLTAASMILGCSNANKAAGSAEQSTADSTSAAPSPSSTPDGVDTLELDHDVPIIGAKGLFVMVRSRPDMKGASKLGFLRLGGMVERYPDPVAGTGCTAHRRTGTGHPGGKRKQSLFRHSILAA